MRLHAVLALVTVAAGCSPTAKQAADDGGAGAAQTVSGTHSCPADLSGWPYNAGGACFEKSGIMPGICTDTPPPPNTTGLEAVCAADANHQMYVLVVSTDVSLSGTGWTFGTRQAPDLVQDGAPLSSADQATCEAAMSAFSALQPQQTAMCPPADGGH